MPQYFAIIGKRDNPVYEAEFTTQHGQQGQLHQGFPQHLKELNPFIMHASLDIIEDIQWKMNPNVQNGNNNGGFGGFLRSKSTNISDNCYMGKVDHFYGLAITAYLTYSGMKFVMIHGNLDKGSTQIDDSAVKSFYQEVHELYVKTLLNPFYKINDPITCPAFDSRVRVLARKYLNK